MVRRRQVECVVKTVDLACCTHVSTCIVLEYRFRYSNAANKRCHRSSTKFITGCCARRIVSKDAAREVGARSIEKDGTAALSGEKFTSKKVPNRVVMRFVSNESVTDSDNSSTDE